jgi:4-amino-4-deoxy-L-arabinose transferase-like glycosyltransferase
LKRTRLYAAGIFLLAFGFLWSGARTEGITRDESYYFRAGESYSRFFIDLAHHVPLRKAVQDDFAYNSEHPALMKLLFGLSWRFFHGVLGLNEIIAFRLPTLLLCAWLCVLLYRFGERLGGPAAGGIAAALTLFQPQLFFHAQLACFDAPIMVFWFAVVYAYFRALETRTWRWAIATGLLFGLSQGVKFNTLFLPPVLLAHWIYVCLRGGRPKVAPLLAMAVLGPLVFFAHWPWIWFDTLARVRAYFAFHLHHWHYNFEFLGHNYNNPPYPITFPWIETALTVPVVTLALAMGSLVRLIKRPLTDDAELEQATRPGALLVVNAIVPLLILNLPNAPIFGGVKHFLAAMPFLALLGGLALVRLAAAVADAMAVRRRVLVLAALAVAALGPASMQTAYAHPEGLSFYNSVAGGFAGGADLGMNRQFWGYSPRGLFDWMNASLPAGARVYFHDLAQDAYHYYQRSHLLRPDIVYTGLEEPAIRSSQTAIVIHEKHFNYYEYWIWQIYGTAQPVRVLEREGVPLVTVYQRGNP